MTHMKKLPVALQLYTVRDAMGKDFIGTLREVAKIGYAGVEFAGTGSLSASELRSVLSDLGLMVAGSHVGIEALEQELPKVLDFYAELGKPVIVCPYLPEERRKSADDWKRTAALFNKVGSTCRQHGMVFAYHNHAFEFEKFGDRTGMDILLESADPDLVRIELDLYWAKFGGQDPVAFVKRLGKRVALVHLKDMAADAERSFAEVGEGILPWAEILEACADTSTSWYIVEQDVCRRSALESAAISLANLRKMGLG